jgi:predicted signal transduction protein with EAL and GGDEF domain
MEALLYIANSLYLTSYLVRNMLHLRMLSITAALCLVGYFSTLPQPLVTVIAWNLVFVGLNLAHIVMLLRKRQRRRPATPSAGNDRARVRKQLSNILGHLDIG